MLLSDLSDLPGIITSCVSGSLGARNFLKISAYGLTRTAEQPQNCLIKAPVLSSLNQWNAAAKAVFVYSTLLLSTRGPFLTILTSTYVSFFPAGLLHSRVVMLPAQYFGQRMFKIHSSPLASKKSLTDSKFQLQAWGATNFRKAYIGRVTVECAFCTESSGLERFSSESSGFPCDMVPGDSNHKEADAAHTKKMLGFMGNGWQKLLCMQSAHNDSPDGDE